MSSRERLHREIIFPSFFLAIMNENIPRIFSYRHVYKDETKKAWRGDIIEPGVGFGGSDHDWDMFIVPLHRRVDKSSFHEINFFIAWNVSIELSAPLLIFNLSGPRSWRGRGVHEVCRVLCEYLRQIYLLWFSMIVHSLVQYIRTTLTLPSLQALTVSLFRFSALCFSPSSSCLLLLFNPAFGASRNETLWIEGHNWNDLWPQLCKQHNALELIVEQ